MTHTQPSVNYINGAIPHLNKGGIKNTNIVAIKKLIAFFEDPNSNKVTMNEILELDYEYLVIALEAIKIYLNKECYKLNNSLDNHMILKD